MFCLSSSLSTSLILSCAIIAAIPAAAQNVLSPTKIASLYGLTSSTSLPFPAQTLSSTDAASFLQSNWDITKRGDITNKADVSFVTDPLTANPSPVLEVLYPAGSYSSSSGTTFGTYFNDSSTGFGTVQISYGVGFDVGFDFVKGGKLPGLRGGDLQGCDGGVNSAACFSSRIMWRTNGTGEAYVYAQGQNSLCKHSNVLCNDDGYGASISRGSFSFIPGTWCQIDMVVSLNNPVDSSNGFIAVYYNGAIVINQTEMQIRSNSSVESIQGMFFSSFFGGSDSSWAPSNDQHAYFRTLQMFASDDASTLKSSAKRSSVSAIAFVFASVVAITVII